VKFQDIDPHGEVLVKFTVNIYWAMQFQVMREEEVQRTAMRRGREGRAGGKDNELAGKGGGRGRGGGDPAVGWGEGGDRVSAFPGNCGV
jgi:hypothetical protein